MGNRYVCFCLTLFILLSLCPADETLKPDSGVPERVRGGCLKNAFDFGLQVGYASFQSLVPHFDASKRCLIALNHARRAARKMNPVVPRLPIMEIKALIERYGYPTSVGRWNKSQAVLNGKIIEIRTRIGQILQQENQYLYAAYGLGANLAIAEAQFTEGKPPPRVVRTGLANARQMAVLLGLDVSSIDGVIAAIDSSRPLEGYYPDLVAIREGFSAALRAVSEKE